MYHETSNHLFILISNSQAVLDGSHLADEDQMEGDGLPIENADLATRCPKRIVLLSWPVRFPFA